MMIRVNYQTFEERCYCCARAFDEPILSEKEIELTNISISIYTNWQDYMAFEEDLRDAVERLLCDRIESLKCGNESIRISDGEIVKVIEYIKRKCKEGVIK